jgi:hypothetical protein
MLHFHCFLGMCSFRQNLPLKISHCLICYQIARWR